MNYCIECLYPSNHPLGIIFTHNGVCSGCIIHKEKLEINWENKAKELQLILDKYRNISLNNWDCIIPVSGGRDSYFIVDLIKNKYKMNPLLVTYNKQYNSHIGNRNLAYLKTIFDCDHINFTVDPKIVKKITRYTLREFGSIYWHCIAGEIIFPVRIAVNFKIPLIIWGVHQGVDQVGMFSHHDKVEMNQRYRLEHDMMGYSANKIIDANEGFTRDELSPYIYPHDNEIESVAVRGIFLSNYIPWDTKKQHELMIRKYNYTTMDISSTIDNYNDVDSLVYTDTHDYIKYVKHGYGKITDHLTREIRWGRINRNDAIDILNKYPNEYPELLNQFLDWIDISKSDFFKFVESFRNKEVWKKNSKNNFVLKKPIQKYNKVVKGEEQDLLFNRNDIDYSYSNKYILLERGYKEKYES